MNLFRLFIKLCLLLTLFLSGTAAASIVHSESKLPCDISNITTPHVTNMSEVQHKNHSKHKTVHKMSSDMDCPDVCQCATMGCSAKSPIMHKLSALPVLFFRTQALKFTSDTVPFNQQTSLYRPPISA